MITVEAAKEIILESINALRDTEKVKLKSALGRVLAVDICSDSDVPAFDNSAMDGYAIRASDVKGATTKRPKILKVIGDLPAGRTPSKTVQPGEAIRIMTGAPLPQGANSVVMVEDTKNRAQAPELVEIFREVETGKNIRKAGEGVKRGDLVISKGLVVRPAELGMLAALGISLVEVIRKPDVAILATGDEVVDVDDALAPGKIRNSNSNTLHGQVIQNGGIPIDLGIAKDDYDKIRNGIRRGLDADMLLVSGGVSVGEYDLVKDVLVGLGAEMKFWKVAMKPGKPLAFGLVDGTSIFGLPGNPVSSMVAFELLVRSALLKLAGREKIDRLAVKGIMEEELKKKPGLRSFVRVWVEVRGGRYYARVSGPQGSGILRSMVLANGLVVVPEEVTLVKAGDEVSILLLDQPEV